MLRFYDKDSDCLKYGDEFLTSFSEIAYVVSTIVIGERVTVNWRKHSDGATVMRTTHCNAGEAWSIINRLDPEID